MTDHQDDLDLEDLDEDDLDEDELATLQANRLLDQIATSLRPRQQPQISRRPPVMSELGRCRYDPCGQTDLLPYDGYCSQDHQDQDQQGGKDQDFEPSGPPP